MNWEDIIRISMGLVFAVTFVYYYYYKNKQMEKKYPDVLKKT